MKENLSDMLTRFLLDEKGEIVNKVLMVQLGIILCGWFIYDALIVPEPSEWFLVGLGIFFLMLYKSCVYSAYMDE